ncbi:uncharacterized protein PHA67_000299 isoform 2-T2 [Liasis olivaceus]
MTKHTGFRRACSLRVPKSPGLLDRVPGRLYGSLEESPLPWEAEEAPWKGTSSLSPSQEGAPQEAAGNKGSCRRRAASLKVRKIREEDAALAGEATHALSPSDGQQLIGEAHAKAGSRIKQCRKVNRALQRGWESFLTNVYRLTLARSAPPASSSRQ